MCAQADKYRVPRKIKVEPDVGGCRLKSPPLSPPLEPAPPLGRWMSDAPDLELSQYYVSHGAACFGTLEDAVERKREVAALAPGSALLILERETGADGLEYVQFVAGTEADGQSVLWSLDSPFIKHLGTKGSARVFHGGSGLGACGQAYAARIQIMEEPALERQGQA
jgi:hypothetical protein